MDNGCWVWGPGVATRVFDTADRLAIHFEANLGGLPHAVDDLVPAAPGVQPELVGLAAELAAAPRES